MIRCTYSRSECRQVVGLNGTVDSRYVVKAIDGGVRGDPVWGVALL